MSRTKGGKTGNYAFDAGNGINLLCEDSYNASPKISLGRLYLYSELEDDGKTSIELVYLMRPNPKVESTSVYDDWLGYALKSGRLCYCKARGLGETHWKRLPAEAAPISFGKATIIYPAKLEWKYDWMPILNLEMVLSEYCASL